MVHEVFWCFVQSEANYSLFTRGHGENFVALLVYVDDILLIGSSNENIAGVKKLLSSLFILKDLGAARYFFGIEITRSSNGIFLSQRKYYLQVLEDVGLLNAKPVLSLMDHNLKFSKDDGVFLSMDEASSYRRVIGRLLYLQITRSS